jgi:hypothetical protein
VVADPGKSLAKLPDESKPVDAGVSAQTLAALALPQAEALRRLVG